MPLMDWTDKLSVNVPEMDFQHKKLIAMINQLHEAMASGKGNDILKTLLDDLARYTATHFAAEERYMASIRHPLLAAHQQEHADLTGQVQELRAQFSSGKTMLSVKTMNFLKSWLTTHILGSDKKYGANAA